MDTIFMNYENSKTFDTYRLLLNLPDKTDLRRKNKYIALSKSSHLLYMEKHEKVL